MFGSSGQGVLLITGTPRGNETRQGNVFGLTNVESDKVTCQNYPSYPLLVLGATGGLIKNEPFICGGQREQQVMERIDHCYTLTQDNAKLTAQMSIARSSAKSIVINDETLFLTGGFNETMEGKKLALSEFVTPNQPSKSGPELPYSVYLHCFIKVNASMAIVAGGRASGDFNKRKTLFFDIVRINFKTGPKLNEAREFQSCGRLNVDGTSYIVAIGGSGSKTVEVWRSTTEDLWTKGPDFPTSEKATCCGETITGRDGNWLLYLAGNSINVHKFTLDSDKGQFKWSMLESKRSVARARFVAIELPPDIMTCTVVN